MVGNSSINLLKCLRLSATVGILPLSLGDQEALCVLFRGVHCREMTRRGMLHSWDVRAAQGGIGGVPAHLGLTWHFLASQRNPSIRHTEQLLKLVECFLIQA